MDESAIARTRAEFVAALQDGDAAAASAVDALRLEPPDGGSVVARGTYLESTNDSGTAPGAGPVVEALTRWKGEER